MTDPLDDRLRDALHRAADAVSVDPAGAETLARRGRARRWRRRGLGGLAAAALGLAGLVVATRDQDGDLQISDDPAPTTTAEVAVPAEEPAAGADGSSDGASGDVAAPVEANEETATPTTASTAETTESASASVMRQPFRVLPWEGGLLAISMEGSARPLPDELPDELREIVPDDILELFADGLPPTIEQATEMLSDAGLLDEMTDLLAEHPELEEFVYSTPAPGPTVTAEVSTDGLEWTATEIELPMRGYPQFDVLDGVLVAWAEVPSADAGTRLAVARTADLATWELVEHDLPPAVETRDLPDDVQTQQWVSSLTVRDDEWFAFVSTEQWIDPAMLLPADLQATLDEVGYSVGTDDDGVTIEFQDPDTGEWTVVDRTWDELGVDDSVTRFDGRSTTTLLRGDFAGELADLGPPPVQAGATITTAGDSLVAASGTVWISADGSGWTEVPDLPTDGYAHVAARLPDGDLLIEVQSARGTEAVVLDAGTGTVTPTELPELPNPYALWNDSGVPAWVVDAAGQPAVEPTTVVVEYEGIEVSLTDGPESETIVATDLATGEVIYELTQRRVSDDFVEHHEWDEATGEGWLVLRADDGAELVRIPEDEINRAYRRQATDTLVEPEWNPDLWLVATVDARTWTTVDLPDDTTYQHVAAIVDDHVVYSTLDGWERVPLAR